MTIQNSGPLQGRFSSVTCEWSTPDSLFLSLDSLFHFEIDLCADASNAKCRKYFTSVDDALHQEWKGVCWLNPPYGRNLGSWVKKAYESSLRGSIVVCLLPARTDTRWFHDYCLLADIRFCKGRLRFGGAKSNAPFPSMIVVFGAHNVRGS